MFKNINKKSAGLKTIVGLFVIFSIVGKQYKIIRSRNINDENQYLNHNQERLKDNKQCPNIYLRIWKPVIDKILSFLGLVILAPVYIAISLAIIIDDPGTVLFTQKRVGQDKHFFVLHKFRTMKMSTPHDVPTHQLSDPEKYITRVGRILRKTSLDELPQIWDIFIGNMSIIGPRPALWNQYDLVSERDKYGANKIKPGLTGWAQINGRDELEIPYKAKLDGDYTKVINYGGMRAFFFDVKCFNGTIFSVIKKEGVVEGGTGEMDKESNIDNIKPDSSKINRPVNLWILHHYASLPNLNGHIRPYRFAKHLLRHDINTTIFAASFQHFSGYNLINDSRDYLYQKTEDGIPYVFINTPSSEAGFMARIKNMLSFYFGMMGISNKYADKYGKPDVILASSPQPLAMVAGIKLAKKYNVPCICEVRDLWPEAVFNVSDRLKENSVMGKALVAGEHWIYKHADAMVFTKEGDTDYLKEHRWTTESRGDIDLNKCFYINNGIELKEYEEEISTCTFKDSDLEDNSFKIVYAGAIRPVNNVGNILDAAKLLSDESDIKILIYGDGNERESLEKRVQEEKITNVIFKGFVEKKYIPYILSKSSINLLNYSSENYNWSRGNSSNKLFEYLASGRVVISTVKTGYSIIQKYQCGVEMNRQTPQGLADAIMFIKKLDPEKYQKYCKNAKKGAADFDYGILSDKLLNVIRFVEEKNAK